MNATQHKAPTKPRRLASLRRDLDGAGITQRQVAAAAGVDHTTVCSVLAGRSKSKRIVATAKRLIAEAREARERMMANPIFAPSGALYADDLNRDGAA